MKTQNYVRKPVTITAVQVTEADMNDIANWCGGRIVVDFENPTQTYVKVRVIKPQDERQTQAFVNDWILKLGKSFKVYTDEAFKKGFDPAPVELANDAHLHMLKDYLNGPEQKKNIGGIIRSMSGGAFTSVEDYNAYHAKRAKEEGMEEWDIDANQPMSVTLEQAAAAGQDALPTFTVANDTTAVPTNS